jgi:hypothetical protein
MNPRKLLLPAVPVVLSALGCVPTATVPGPKYTIVPTETAGVVFVIVHPKMNKQGVIQGVTQPGDDNKVGNNADYIMLCDGRPVDGMRCEMLTEAAMSRFSYHPLTGNASAAVEEQIGSTFVYSYSDNVSQSRGTIDMLPRKGAAEDATTPPVLPPPPPSSSSNPAEAPSSPNSASHGGSK